MNDIPHAWFSEEIPAFLTDGLDAAERDRFVSHANECPACAAALAEARGVDAELLHLFPGAPAGMEDRMIQRLRAAAGKRIAWKRPTMRIHPMVRRAAVGVAATILVGALGWAGTAVLQGDKLQNAIDGKPGAWRELASAISPRNLAQVGTKTSAPTTVPAGMLTFNFQEVPTESFLQYLSKKAANDAAMKQQMALKSQGEVDLGREAELAGNAQAAADYYAQAAVDDPTNHTAVDGRDRVQAQLGIAQSGAGGGGSGGRTTIEIQAIGTQFNTGLSDAHADIAANNFAKAQADLDRAEQATTQDPTVFNASQLQDLNARLADSRKDLEQAKVDYQLQQKVQGSSDAQSAESAREKLKLSENQTAIDSLVKLSRAQLDAHNYAAALGVDDQILALDPNNEYANGVRQLVQDKAAIQDQQQKSYTQFSNQLSASSNGTTADSDILGYPGGWPDINGITSPASSAAAANWGINLGGYADVSYMWDFTKPAGTGDVDAFDGPYKNTFDVNKIDAEIDRPISPDPKLALAGGNTYSGATSINNGKLNGGGGGFGGGGSGAASGGSGGSGVGGSSGGLVSAPVFASRGVSGGLSGDSSLNGGQVFNSFKAPTAPAYSFADKIANPTPVAPEFFKPAALGGESKLSDTETFADGIFANRSAAVAGGSTGEFARNKAIPSFDAAGAANGNARNADQNAKSESAQLGYSYANPNPDKVAASAGQTLTKLDPALDEAAKGAKPADDGKKDLTGAVAAVTPADVTPPAGGAVNPPVDPNQPAAGAPAATPAGAPANTGPAPAPTPAPAPAAAPARQIIRHGEMSFEVDSFDSASLQIAKIVTEAGGFVSTSSSEKLDNGKVRGVVSVRVPPEHLDILVLQLRGLGDLKGQKIVSDDITREYTDLQSELRAATVMENRLLDIIKNGNGEVKDLVEAEKELGVWREKVEQVTGQINYYNNLVALSTLEITLTERDIRQAALASENETVNMGIETVDVEKGRADALKAIEDAKGRVVQSDLKQFDAGQLAATITATVPPDAAGPVIDRLKQLGRVARLDIGRGQTTANGTPVAPGVKVDRKDTQLIISLYNLANIAPRQTTNLSLASADVEKSYQAIISQVTDAGGRVVNSSLNRTKPEQVDATINFETPADKADAVLAQVRAQGEVMHLTVTENPDAANVTAAKRGFAMTLASMATVAPRETIGLALMPAGSVADAYRQILTAAQAAGANVATAQLQEQNSQTGAATLVFDIPRTALADMEKTITGAIGSGGRVISRQSTRSADTEHTLDSKVQLSITFASFDSLGPREAISRTLAVADVPKSYNDILASAQQNGAKIVAAQLNQNDPQHIGGTLDLVVPAAGIDAVEKAIIDTRADVVSRSVTRAADVTNTTEEKTELRLTIADIDQLLGPRESITRVIAVTDVPAVYNAILSSAQQMGAKVNSANLSQADRQRVAGELVLVVPRSGIDKIEKILTDAKAGIVSRSVTRATDMNTTTEEKTELRLAINDVDQIPPRQTTTLSIDAADPEKQMSDIQTSAIAAGGRVVEQNLSKDDRLKAHVVIDVPLKYEGDFLQQARGLGTVTGIEQQKDYSIPDADFVHARLDITLGSEQPIVSQETGVGSTIKASLGKSIRGLLFSLEIIIVGICMALPWGVGIWLAVKLWKKIRRKAVTV